MLWRRLCTCLSPPILPPLATVVPATHAAATVSNRGGSQKVHLCSSQPPIRCPGAVLCPCVHLRLHLTLPRWGALGIAARQDSCTLLPGHPPHCTNMQIWMWRGSTGDSGGGLVTNFPRCARRIWRLCCDRIRRRSRCTLDLAPATRCSAFSLHLIALIAPAGHCKPASASESRPALPWPAARSTDAQQPATRPQRHGHDAPALRQRRSAVRAPALARAPPAPAPWRKAVWPIAPIGADFSALRFGGR